MNRFLPRSVQWLILSAIWCFSYLHVQSQCTPRVNSFFGDVFVGTTCGSLPANTAIGPGWEYARTRVYSGLQYRWNSCSSPFDTQLTLFQGNNSTTPFAVNDNNGPECSGTRASINVVPGFNDYIRWQVHRFFCSTSTTSALVRVRQINNLSMTFSSGNMCEGTTRSLTATPAASPTTLSGAGNRGTFSGTGVSGTTFTAPNQTTQTSTTYTITYTKGFCSATRNIAVFNNPSTANAGTDQTVCSTAFNTTASTPTVGTGTWTVISGSGTFANANDPTTTISGMSVGVNQFRWTVSNGPCATSTDDLFITRDENPTTSNAGTDQNLCATSTTITANTATVGTGVWTLVSGSGTITSPSSPSTTVTNLGVGANVFRWTITNGTCPASTDDVIITRDEDPTTANAGTDQTICSTSGSLNANTPSVGTGTWTVVTGSGSFSNANSPTTTVSGLGIGANVFRWTIANGTCPSSSDVVTINRDEEPTTANAGADQQVCATTTTLAGNTPSVGTGAWTLVSGQGTITTPSSPTSGVTNLGVGANTFRWTTSNGVCPNSTDDIVVTRDSVPTVSNAGPDQTVCDSTATLAGNTPTIGTGMWSLVSGQGTITTPSSATSGITNLGVGANVFRWVITNGVCPVSDDTVTISRDDFPTVSDAGVDQNVCTDSTTLAGNTPTIGSGMWMVVSGTGSVNQPTNPTSVVSGLVVGNLTLEWVITNGVCPPSRDTVVIERAGLATPAFAGADQTICDTNYTMAANPPATGTGTWTLVSGSANIVSPNANNTQITNLGVGANTFAWTIVSGSCPPSSDTVVITRDSFSLQANAGPDESVCDTTYTLQGNAAAPGFGTWAFISGSGTITNVNDPNSTITGLGLGTNILSWTIVNGTCPATSDIVVITRAEFPSASDAGPDTTLCQTSYTMSANTPSVGTGTWSILSGSATISNPNSPTTGISNIGAGTNEFVWTIVNGVCTPNRDTVTITRDDFPDAADAGNDTTVCDSSVTLMGNTPTVGTGMWTLVSGAGNITSPGNATTGVTGLGVGTNVFAWTISNGICPVETDTVEVTRDDFPTIANAGPDQMICDTVATLAGNTATVGTGMWTIIAGPGTVTNPMMATSSLTGIGTSVSGDTTCLVWTIGNGVCPSTMDTVYIYSDSPDFGFTAGPDTLICDTSYTMQGVVPSGEPVTWSLVSGSGTITNANDPNTTITGLGVGANEFELRLAGGICPDEVDTVTVTRDNFPTVANAGADQTVCDTNATLAGNTPSVGMGNWTVIAGGATVTNPMMANSGVTDLSVGTNTFVWTITNGGCPSTSDTVSIFRDDFPSIANAGPDQTICDTSVTISGNVPAVGTGMWTLIGGSGTITSPSTATTTVSNLGVGANTFVWTISNGVCPSESDTVVITRDDFSTQANAGTDQIICDTTTTMAANTATVGTGTWSVIAGAGTFTNVNDPNTTVTGLGVGANVFQWSIQNGVCPATQDFVTVVRQDFPSAADAGPDSTICAINYDMQANTPSVGVGTWTLASGSGIIASPNSPTTAINNVGVGANTFVWTISNGVCPTEIDSVTITRDDFPTVSNAGPDQTICDTVGTLAGNMATVGNGMWTVIAGGATVTNPMMANSGVTGLDVGTNTFVWTISNGVCPPTMDTVDIVRDDFPTIAMAGPDQTICDTTVTLAGNMATVGTGTWTQIAGTGNITDPNDPATTVTNLSTGTNEFVWTISNGVCPPTMDTVVIQRDGFQTIADAGNDTTICDTVTTLDGNTPVVGMGTWTVIVGGATVTSPTDPQSGVTGLDVGANTFVWTITNGTCPSSADTVTITRDDFPTMSMAGNDTTICDTTFTLNGNMATVGTGMWTVIAGGATVTNPMMANSGVTNLSVGTNTFVWTISNGVCMASMDTVTVTRNDFPTVADAGTDQAVCDSTATLNANAPSVGTGTWTLVGGSGTIANPNNDSTQVTNLGVGVNTFVWTISNGVCPSSTDTVTITRDPLPSAAVAGADQIVCDSVVTLNATAPAVGTGQWALAAGSGTITNPFDPNTTVTNLGAGANQFLWTVNSGVCPSNSDLVQVIRILFPTTANAGPDQSVCDTVATMAANTPTVGLGAWTLIGGTGTITNPNSPTTTVTNLSGGANTFVWTITNGSCPPSRDTVVITRDLIPTVADAGNDTTICDTTYTLAGNTPSIGTGTWTLISGSGTITNPMMANSTVTGLGVGTNTFAWTISNGVCPSTSDTVNISRDDFPTMSMAGNDTTICDTTFTLQGNMATVGMGMWTLVSGSGNITNPMMANSTVTGLGVGPNTFVWTITNGTCPASIDSVTISRDDFPTMSMAGNDTTVCDSSFTLQGNMAVVGTGMWTLISGSGNITNPMMANSTVTGLGVGTNTFVWTISNGVCMASMDTVNVSRDDFPTVANAGPDQTICDTTATLAGNTAVVGTGTWIQVSGTGTITNPNDPNTTVTNISTGTNVFLWTISNGVCPSTSDSVTIQRDGFQTTAMAGPDQTICDTTATLAGNTATVGTGTWTLASGSGTITNPNDPASTVTNLGVGTNTFVWSIVNGICPPSRDTVEITRDDFPTMAMAGADQMVCDTVATLAGNVPTVGMGMWTIINGPGTVTNPMMATSTLTGIGTTASGDTTCLVWTISNGVCPSTMDTVYIYSDSPDPGFSAGVDTTICDTTYMLMGVVPSGEPVMWSLVSGSGNIANPNMAMTAVSGLGVGNNVFELRMAGGICPDEVDTVTISRDDFPTMSMAGPDQNVCDTVATLAGNTPTVGTGTWFKLAGPGSITNANNPNTTVTGLGVGTNTFIWVIQNGVCTPSIDTVNITRDEFPTTAMAGADFNICADSFNLAGNTPSVGTGAWTQLFGSSTIVNPNDPNSQVTGTALGANVFVWTITNGTCPPSRDTVVVTRDLEPTVANAGPDQNICDTTTTLAGNTPVIGTGTWTVVTGLANLANPNDPNTTVSGLSVGQTVLVWGIANGTCPTSEDTVSITRDDFPTIANAGPDQTVCDTTATLVGNTATVGTGMWALVSGSGNITSPGSATTTVTNLGVGTNTFAWTITNGACPASSDTVSVTRDDFPTMAMAGPDQTVCDTTITLAGNTATVGTGTWTQVAGGGTITNPNDPNTTVTNVGAGLNTFVWTITNGVCPASFDSVNVTRDVFPTTANAGSDQTVCDTTAFLSGNTATVGTGMWALVSGSGTIVNPGNNNTNVTNLGVGANVFTWSITNGSCPASVDTVVITRDDFPTVSNAGPDQTVCDTTVTLAGNTATVGMGMWTLISGSGNITNPMMANTTVTNLGLGANTFVWTISNGVCPSTSDTVTITRDDFPTASNAGPDQTVCDSTATLTGNVPSVGSGMWMLISGSGTITSDTSASTTVTNLGVGANTFIWSISNGVCPPSVDTVVITRDDFPTMAMAGPDQTVCDTVATLAGNTATVGMGMWTSLGSATVDNPMNATSGVSNLAVGANSFVWTISNGVCPSTSDTVVITRDDFPTMSMAGPDQTVCDTVATLAGNTATVGTGMWTSLGSATVDNPMMANSGVSNLAVGANSFVWTISNGVCPSSSDTVVITRDDFPTMAMAGPDQTVCDTVATLAGNMATVGMGMWTSLGSATVDSPMVANSGVSNLAVGANSFVWTISNGVCPSTSDTVVITRDDFPTMSMAGPDQTVCDTVATLAGNTATVGTGMWTSLGSATVDNPMMANSGVSNLAPGANDFVWTISNGTCPSSSDTVTITRDDFPSIANAGPDQNVCDTTITLAGNTPAVGTGTWTILIGSGNITNANDPNTTVTNVGVGVNVFQWTISNGTCPSNSDAVTVTRSDFPTVAMAGADTTICASTYTLAANTPTVGSGLWTVVSGSGALTNATSPTSSVINLSTGPNVLVWSISNGSCPASTDTIIITRDEEPTVSNAGPDQTVCDTVATLAGNMPTVGMGMWTSLGTATVDSPMVANSGVSNLAVGPNTFVWTISNGVCPSSSDTVVITRDDFPTVANAGPDQTVCDTTATLAGNTPVVGTGTWFRLSGTGNLTNPNDPNTTITGLGVGTSVWLWTIQNGACPPSIDTVSITRDDFPTAAFAGLDMDICADSVQLMGNSAAVGTGTWTIIAGSGNIANVNDPMTVVNNLGLGGNTFVWTISNGVCPSNSDTVTITRDSVPTVSNAGPDQTICDTTVTLAGNMPSVGVGNWTQIAGTGNITNSSDPNTTVTNLSAGTNIFVWSIISGVCPASNDTVVITRDEFPTVAMAGPDQTVCDTVATLAGNTATVGMGMWTSLGTATVDSPMVANSGVSNLAVGANSFVWTISNGVCPSTSDTVTITRDDFPTMAMAGPDQTVCDTVATLAGNTATVGTGMWSLVSGGGTITNPGMASTTVTNLGFGANTFVWTISNGVCPSSSDTVVITRDIPPTTANAGPDQAICDTTAFLAGNTPTVGTGMWALVSGSGTITSPTAANTTVTGLGAGANTFTWTITNGGCPPSVDTVVISRDDFPTMAMAGPDQTVCDTVATLAGNMATVGMGMWTSLGSATVDSPMVANSGVSNLAVGANTFVWTISNGVCPSSSDTVVITRDDFPTTANAGADQAVCDSTATLMGNSPSVGTGMWALVSGSGTITSDTSATTTVTGLGVGMNTFTWTITNGSCPPSVDTVVITRDELPTMAMAGADSTICDSTFTLNGNTPTVGTGMWSLASGSGTITSPGSASTTVTGLGIGANTFVWTISNGVCPSSSDTVVITRDSVPSIANAGPDQTVCDTTATMAANTPASGTGTWALVSGSGTITNANDPMTTITNLGVGANVFTWTITSGGCNPSVDSVTITRDDFPTMAMAGADTTICDSSYTLGGNTPTVGNGTWFLLSGSGNITNPTNPNSPVTNLGVGANTFAWVISNGVCPATGDTVTVTRDDFPTMAMAGADTTICDSTYTLDGNTPTVGTGMWSLVSGSGTITSPSSANSTVTGLGVGANTFVWTISNGVCMSSTDTVVVTRDDFPTMAMAGNDTTVCDSTVTLNGNTPTVGTGMWSLISGSGTITSPSSANSTVTGLGVGANTFAWTISNGVCMSSTDTVVITRDDFPSMAMAGADTTICDSTYTLGGNTPTVGTGMWSLISGSGTITSPSSANSTVTGLGVGANTFVWTITNGVCVSNTDTVVVTRDDFPTMAMAGADTTICDSSYTLAGNTPTVGSGMWSLISGSGTITSPSSANSTVTGLGVGANTFVWTISNGVCMSSTDTVVVTRDDFPTMAMAGNDTTICDSSYTLAGNTPTVGSGMWSLVSGSGTITSPSSANSTVTGLGVGANTFVWTISNGVCMSSTDTVVVTRDDFPTMAMAGADTTICDSTYTLGGNTPTVGSGMWSLISGSGTITSPSSANSTVTGLGVGANTFVWTISNGVCMSSTDTVVVTRDDFPTMAMAGADTTICDSTYTLGGNTPTVGTGMWSLISGSGTITSPSSANSTVTGLGVGANTFVWTISNGVCMSSTDTVVVTRDDFPTMAMAGNDTTICDSSYTLAGNIPTVGTGMWSLVSGSGTITSPSSANSTVTGLGVGANTFVWTISNGVCMSSTDTVVVTRDDFPTMAMAGNDTTVCDSTYTLGGNTPTVGTGMWSLVSGTGTITSPSSANSTVTGLGVGTNTFVWTISNGVCMSSTDTVVITRDDFPTMAMAGMDVSTCDSTEILQGNAPSVGVGVWSVIAGSGTVSNVNDPNSQITGLSVGANTFVWTISNGVCNSSTDTVTITRLPQPTVAVSGNTTICAGFTTTLTASSSAAQPGFVWTDAASGGSVLATTAAFTTPALTATDTFWVTVLDSATTCISDPMMVIVTVNQPLAVNLGADTSICFGSTITFDAGPGGVSYLWAPGGATTQTFTANTADVYSVEVTDSNGCVSRDTIVLGVNPLPTVSLGPDTAICPNDTLILDAGAGFSAYAWSNGTTGQTASFFGPGTYSVTVTDANGCSNSDTLVASQIQLPDSIITVTGPLVACQNDVVTLTADSGFVSYLWSTGDTTRTINVTAPTATYTVVATDAQGCDVTDSRTISFLNQPNPNPIIFPPTPVNACAGDTITLDAGSGYATYLWSNGDTTQTISVTGGGSFDVTVTNGFGCEGISDSVNVIFNPLPTPVITQSGDTLFAKPANYTAYQWFRDGVAIPGALNNFYLPTEDGTYCVTVVDSNGCEGDTCLIFVANEEPTVDTKLYGLRTYPNPTTGNLNLSTMRPINEALEVRIYDMVGHEVQVYNFERLIDAVQLDMSLVADGMYLMKVRSGNKSTIFRIVKEN